MRSLFHIFGGTIFTLCLAMTSLAGEQTDGDIPEAEWRDMAEGRTLTYMVDGAFFALEHYSLTGNRVMIQMFDGQCMAGTWSHDDGQYCYRWEGDTPVCFRHMRSGGSIFILEVENGVETGAVQTMTGASDAPLVCGGLIG